MARDKIRDLIESVAKTIIEHTEELTELDQAIGDGDHGLNMKRGLDAVLAGLDSELDKPLADVLKYVGTTLVMKVGGADEVGAPSSTRFSCWLPLGQGVLFCTVSWPSASVQR